MARIVALAVNLGNLGRCSPERRPVADQVRELNARFCAQHRAVRVIAFFGHTGNFLLESEEQLSELTRWLGLLIGTPSAVMPVARLEQGLRAVQTSPAPAIGPGRRWTPGVVFRVTGAPSAAAVEDQPTVRFQRIDDSAILAWKWDIETPAGRLDRARREGGWGAVSSAVRHQLGGVWTARSARTLNGVMKRLAHDDGGSAPVAALRNAS